MRTVGHNIFDHHIFFQIRWRAGVTLWKRYGSNFFLHF